MEIKDDGTQTLTLKIPKYFISEVPNERITNPRWKDIETGILAENTRVLKVSIQFADDSVEDGYITKVFPFIIDKIVNRRDNSFGVYKEVTGNGLAFAELGKIGYKLELTADTLEIDFAKDSDTVANINYWLDKVFPNIRDEAGNVIRWLTPWSYEIRMDWRGYFQDASDFLIDGGMAAQLDGYSFYNARGAAETLNNKDKNWLVINSGSSRQLYQIRDEETIYEDAYVTNWITWPVKDKNDKVLYEQLVPTKVTSFEEKARYVNCSNSNKYNITQDIAEAFGVFCTYEYEVDDHGYFRGTYWDEIGRVWTGKRVIFYNRAIKTDDPYTINYQHNLQSISRTIDSSEIYTKLYVTPLQSEISDTGYVSIADTPSNPLLDEFILNFDYLHSIGSVTDEQYDWIEHTYKTQLNIINRAYIKLEQDYNDLTISLNDAQAELATAKAELASAQEQLGNYQTLRDNDTYKQPVVKDEHNSYSITLVPQTASNINQGTFRVTGIDASTIECYNNSAYEHNPSKGKKCLFKYGSTDPNIPAPYFVKSSPGQAASLPNDWFIMTDEDGFPSTVYTSLENSQTGFDNFSTGAIVYFKLSYWPKNKYAAICTRFEATIAEKEDAIKLLEEKIDHEDPDITKCGLNQQIQNNTLAREELQKEKEDLNYQFERLLGPAVREGYWQAEDYEDPGQGINIVFSRENSHPETNTYYIFDDKLFEDEQKNYYVIANTETAVKYENKYYPYIDLSELYQSNALNNVEEFVIELEHPEFSAEITEESGLTKTQQYRICYNSDFFYFNLPDTLPKGSHLYLKLDPGDTGVVDNTPIFGYIRKVLLYYNTPTNTTLQPILWLSKEEASSLAIDITSRFAGLQQFLGVRSLYNNGGFIFSFLNTSKDKDNPHIIPVALLNATDINYENYTQVSYAASATAVRQYNPKLTITSNDITQYPIVYPRVKLDYRNVNYNSDNLVVHCNATHTINADGEVENNPDLIKYEDYQIMLREGRPYITLKVTNNNLIKYILDFDYNIIYQVSRANEMLYLDARQVAKDNSKPKYSYEVEIGNIPDEMEHIELGQLVYVCDWTIDAERERGYVSGIKYQLDQPSKDTITIANYKTKFEDLFSSISAQNEAMKQNQTQYNIAAQAFTSNGEIAQETLQQTLDNTNAHFEFGNNTLTLDKSGGMIITNESSYRNGVYGQIKLIGGGIFCSDSVDAEGERIWSTGITPKGINASLITAGQIDTKFIRILSGDQTRFQWNESGLYAFGDDTTVSSTNNALNIDTTTFVRFNENGLLFQKKGTELLSLDWNGLRIGAQNNSVRITSENGFEVYDQSGNRLVQLGRHYTGTTDANSQYGLAMYNTDKQKTLYTDQNGNLHLTGKLTIGSGEGYVCLNGAAKNAKDVVLMAGSQDASQAEFVLYYDGTITSKGKTVKLVEA